MDITSKINYLFNKNKFVATNNLTGGILSQRFSQQDFLFGDGIFIENVPSSPNFSLSVDLNSDSREIKLTASNFYGTFRSEYFKKEASGNVVQLKNIKLTRLENNNQIWCFKDSDNKIINKIIPSFYNSGRNSDGNYEQPYQIKLKTPEQISKYPNENANQYIRPKKIIIDEDSGFIIFEDPSEFNLSEQNYPIISCCVYIGLVGISSIAENTDEFFKDAVFQELQVSNRVAINSSYSNNYKLNIGGDINFTGDLYQNGNIYKEIVNEVGQTYKEVVTQQPHKFNEVDSEISSSDIKIRWNYNNILVDGSNNNSIMGDTDNIKFQMLPMIDKLHVDISGSTHGGISGAHTWVNLANYTDSLNNITYDPNGEYLFANNENYNTNKFKNILITKYPDGSNGNLIENILSLKDQAIDVRIYGINFAKENPSVYSRALVLNFPTGFPSANPPPIPSLQSFSISTSNGNQINIIYQVSATEQGKTGSAALITVGITDYESVDTYSFYAATGLLASSSKSNDINPNVGKDTDFILSLPDLKFGTQYKFKSQVRNNLQSRYSDFETNFNNITSPITYTKFPSTSSTYPISGRTISVGNTTRIETIYSPNFSSLTSPKRDVIYLNKRSSSDSDYFYYQNSNIKFEITNNGTNVSSSAIIGKNTYDSNDDAKLLSTFEVKILLNGNVQFPQRNQKVEFYGGDKNGNFPKNSNPINTTTTTIDNFINNSTSNISDIYSDDQKKGFRLGASVDFKSIPASNFLNPGDLGSHYPYTLRYIYTSDANTSSKLFLNNSNTLDINNIYIDNIENDPIISLSGTDSITVSKVTYIMGIPSISGFTIGLVRNINNMCSSNRIVLYKIYDITIPNTNINNSELTVDELNTNQIASNSGSINMASNILSGTHEFSDNIDNTIQTLTTTERVYSLKPATVTQNFNINIGNRYCDYSSLNKLKTSSNVFNNLHEFSTMTTDSGTTFGDVENIAYEQIPHKEGPTNIGISNIAPKDWTLLYIRGYFQTNTKQPYPSITSTVYNFNNIVASDYNYNAGDISYGLDGTTTGPDPLNPPPKYKWITFLWNNASDFTTANLPSNNLDLNNGHFKISNYFNSNIFTKLFDNDDNEVVGFIDLTTNAETRYFGWISLGFNPTDAWYGKSISGKSLTNIKDGYGAKTDSTKIKVFSPVTNITNIYITIGLKNNVSL
jgi:hypothetical protein